jgi:hypothetical protein
MSTLEQQRMQRAYRALEAAGKEQDAWIRVLKGLGPEVQRSGLLQALAFLHRGPDGDCAEPICRVIREHLANLGHVEPQPDAKGFLIEVRDLDRGEYMRVTREVLAFSVWLKRAAQILGRKD